MVVVVRCAPSALIAFNASLNAVPARRTSPPKACSASSSAHNSDLDDDDDGGDDGDGNGGGGADAPLLSIRGVNECPALSIPEGKGRRRRR